MTPANALDAYRGARALVLGASGFIGRWVAHALAVRGADVISVVRDRAAVSAVLNGVKGTLVEADLRATDAIEHICRSTRPAITFNLAGYGVDPSERDDETACQVNAHLVERVATALADAADSAWPGQQLVHAGSALEYGAVSGPLTEATPPSPTTLYGRSKLQGTTLLEAACRRSRLRATTARLFMVYGAGEHGGRLIPELIRAASHDRPLPLTSGEQRRDFTYVEDAAEGLLRVGLLREPGGVLVNLATGRLTRVRDVVEITARQLGIPHDRLLFGSLPTRGDEMTGVSSVSISRLRDLTGWSPPTTVEEGISRTIRQHQERAASSGQPPAGD